MANYRLQEMNDMGHTGQRKVYPKFVPNRTMNTDDIIERMHVRDPAISKSITKAVLTDLADVLVELMGMGYNVSIDEIGRFTPSLCFDDGKPNEMQGEHDKMRYRKVKVRSVNFKASDFLVKQLNREGDWNRSQSGVNEICPSGYTERQRIDRALQVIRKHGFISLTDYASLNQLSRSSASRELRKITARTDAPLRCMGSGSHKVWVENKEKK